MDSTHLVVTRGMLDAILAHCRSALPDEACGIIAGRDGRAEKLYLMTNLEPSPVSYLMAPEEQFRAMKEMRTCGLGIVAIFHSHPQSPACPSPKDVSLAFYEEAVYVIVGLAHPDRPEVRAYRIADGIVTAVALEVVEGAGIDDVSGH